MAFKFIAVLAFVTVASAGILPQIYHNAPVPTAVIKSVAPGAYAHSQSFATKHDASYNDHPQYKYAYEVNDDETGDNHIQSEERDGDVVRGEYSLIDADGFRRVVQYTVDPHSGFNAVVNRIPLDHHVKAVVKHVDPVTYVAPAPIVVKQYSIPQSYHHIH